MAALHHWKHPRFLTDGTCPDQKDGHNGRVTARVGSNHEGRIVNGVWGPHLCFTHINSLELLAVSLALRHFLP